MKLLLSFVDSVAYLDMGDTADTFVKWLSKFATLSPLGIAPSELWEFRNALLHMTSPLSRKVQSGKVTALRFYIKSSDRTEHRQFLVWAGQGRQCPSQPVG
jgi:hypothetical protein